MADISNKTLALLLVAAIVVSLGGLFISLDRLGRIQQLGGSGFTGFAVSNFSQGRSNVSISNVIAMSIHQDPNNENLIDFQTCTIPQLGRSNVSSNSTNSGGFCTDGSGDIDNFPDNLTIRNDGNVNLLVKLRSPNTTQEFLGSSGTSAAFWAFKSDNESYTASWGGCTKNVNNMTAAGMGYDWCDEILNSSGSGNCTMTKQWQKISPNIDYKVCDNLTFGNNANRNVSVWLQIGIPFDLIPAGQDRKVILNFTAEVLT
ncbi:MAG: hypothetical protein AABX51_04245 [Nanoarchaeota archaeon]